MNNSVHKYRIPHRKIELSSKSSKKLTYQNIANPHRWLKHFPNQSRTTQIRKSMNELSRVMDKHANPGKWIENHGGCVGNKRYDFPS